MTIQQMMLAGSGLLEFNVTIASDTTNYNLLTVLQAAPFNWNNVNPARVTVTINSAVQVSSTSTGTPAFTTGSFVANSLLYIINTGSIKGKGGAAGNGGGAIYDVSQGSGTAGSAGGTALSIASSLSGKVTITNGSGEIFGGGGGGGGGGGRTYTSGSGKDTQQNAVGGGGGGGRNYYTGSGKDTYENSAGGSGGGGGAGTGASGSGGSGQSANPYNFNGNAGAAGTTSAGGAGGAAADAGNSNAGGAGGGFGAVGTAGGSTGGTGGAGGAAGNAIALNGGSAPTFISGNDGTHVKGAVS